MIGLLHLSWILLSAVCSLPSHLSHGWSISGATFSRTCAMPDAFLFYVAIVGLCTYDAFACKCYWPHHCIVRSIIPWEHIASLLIEDLVPDLHLTHLFPGIIFPFQIECMLSFFLIMFFALLYRFFHVLTLQLVVRFIQGSLLYLKRICVFYC